MNEERLADDLDLLHSLHRLGDEQQVREQHAVHVHLREEATRVSARTQSGPVEGSTRRPPVSRTHPAVLALLHLQRPLQVQLSDLLRRRSPHGGHQVEVVVLLQDLMEGQARQREGWSPTCLRRAATFCPRRRRRRRRREFYLLHLLTAALHCLVRVDASRHGGQFLSLLTLAHLRVDAVDEALHDGHLEQGKTHKNASNAMQIFHFKCKFMMRQPLFVFQCI